MKTVTNPLRTQISLSPALKKLIVERGSAQDESMSEYLRRAAIIRMALEENEVNDLKLIADAVVGKVSPKDSGWKGVKDIAAWQRRTRRYEDRHRP